MKTNINLIIQKVTGLSKEQLFLSPKINEKYKKEIDEKIKKLENLEPIEYIINNAEFYWIDFFVDNRVLIPRNDTEVMVNEVLKLITPPPAGTPLEKGRNKIDLIDVWTWSSCIPISILKNTDKINNCFVIDISEKALEVSKININKYWLEKKIEQIQSSILNSFSFPGERGCNLEKNVIITANLPYIKDNDFKNIDKETVQYEPNLALYWWEKTWFELYEKLINQTIELKKNYELEKIILFIEIWFDQKQIAKDYLNKQNLNFEIYKDNWWVDRCIKIDI